VSDALADLRGALLAGEVALLPTDTVYGLAAALDVPRGVEALYALKGRPRAQPVQVLLYDEAALAAALAGLDPVTSAAAAALLPGPVTCLVPDPGGRYAAAAGDSPGTVGLRAPRMAGPIAGLDLPLVATSANHPGGPDPASLADVPDDLRRAVRALDAGTLPGTASAVVDLRAVAGGGAATLVRPGPDPGALERLLGGLGLGVVRPASACTLEADEHQPGGRAA
jgi:L-threonylcarbamoyladenylate synthase